MATESRPDAGATAGLGERVVANVAAAVKAPRLLGEQMLVALLADGHVLIEDYPGVGKTSLARALSRSIDADLSRVQCTPDILPADVLGANIYDRRTARFEFRPGPIFANIVLVDEINRASPKAQSGLLECMEERRVTVDGHSHELARPFMVIATQNPVEYEGTYPLPEAQLDRFMLRVAIGYPDAASEAEMLAEHASGPGPEGLAAVSDLAEVRHAQGVVESIHASEPLRAYVVALVGATREDDRTALGASPRAGLLLLRASKALAALRGRDHVLPDDVRALAEPVLAHRLLLSGRTALDDAECVVRDALDRVPAL